MCKPNNHYVIFWQTPENRLQEAAKESKSNALRCFAIKRSNSGGNLEIVAASDWRGLFEATVASIWQNIDF